MPIETSMGANDLQIRRGDFVRAPWINDILNPAIMANANWRAAVRKGRVMSQTTAGFLTPGILAAPGTGGGPQPSFAWSGLDPNNYPDTQRTRYNGNARDRGMPGYLDLAQNPWSAPGFNGIPTQSTEVMGGFATIGYNLAGELASTAFVGSYTYTPGAALTAVSATAVVESDRGLIRTVAATTDVIIGYVAPAGRFTGPNGYDLLAFTPAYVPGTTVPAAV